MRLDSDRDSDFKVAISNGWVSNDFIKVYWFVIKNKVNSNIGYPEEVTSDIFRWYE